MGTRTFLAALAASGLLWPGCPASAQELPQSAVHALLEYVSREYGADGTLVVELDGFPDVEGSRRAAARAGLPSGLNAQIVRCEEGRRRCWIEGGEKLVRLLGYDITTPGREIALQVIVSTEWESEDGSRRRIFPTARELKLSNREGWAVTGDELLVRG